MTVARRLFFAQASCSRCSTCRSPGRLQQYPPELSQLTSWSKTTEAGLVDQLTAHGLFSSQVESQQVGGSALVLTPLPPQ